MKESNPLNWLQHELKEFWTNLKQIGAEVWAAEWLPIVPLLAMVTLFRLFEFTAERLELKKDLWLVATTNVLTAKTNVPGSKTIAAVPVDLLGSFHSATNLTNYTRVPVLKEPKQTATAATKEYSVRLLWGVAGLFFAFLCIVVAAQSFRLMVSVLFRQRIWFIVLGLMAFAGFLVFDGNDPGIGVPPTAGGVAGEQLLRSIAKNTVPATSGYVGMDPNSLAGLHNLWDADSSRLVCVTQVGRLTNMYNALSKVGLFAAALTACCVLVRIRNIRNKAPQDAIQEYNQLTEACNFLLQLTAAALVCAVIEIFLLYLLAGYHVRAELQHDVRYFAQILATVAGAIYSALLITIFFPLYVELKSFKKRIENAQSLPKAKEVKPEGSTKSELTGSSEMPLWNSMLKILSPVLTAFATMLVSFLKDILGN